MAIKRKASSLEEPVVHNAPSQSPGTPSLILSPASSTSTIPTPTDNHSQLLNSWRIGTIPYMNSRTLKRHRDGRPDEGQIHDHTMKKLYDAQRLHLDEAIPLSEVLSEEESTDEDIAMNDEPVGNTSEPNQLKQKTLESFFTRKETAPTTSVQNGGRTVHEYWNSGAWPTGPIKCV